MSKIYRSYNKFDIFIVVLIIALIGGGSGGAMEPIRLLSLLFAEGLGLEGSRCWLSATVSLLLSAVPAYWLMRAMSPGDGDVRELPFFSKNRGLRVISSLCSLWLTQSTTYSGFMALPM